MGRQNARVFIRLSSFSHPNNKLNDFIFHHPFNSSLQILCPILINSAPTGSLFVEPLVFNRCRVKLSSFISEEFCSMYTEDSDRRFYALSIGSHSDLGDSICVFHNVLRLSLTPESYSRLGLTGRRSSQVKERYIVDVKLNGNCFKPGCHFYERVQTMFRKFDQEFLVWTLSMRNNLSVNLDARLGGFSDVKSERVTFSSCVIKPTQTPQFHIRDSSDRNSSSYLQSLLDWFGAITMGIYDYPLAEAGENAKYQIHCQEWKGMISSDQTNEAVNKCKQTLEDKALPWIAVMVSGFKDTPLSFIPPCQEEGSRFCDFGELYKSDHAVLDDVSGENDYLLLIHPPDQYSLFVNIGSGDNFKTM